MKLTIENPLDYINKVVDFRKSIFNKIASKNNDQIWLKVSLQNVKKVVLINSAPRSGSSLLFTILRKIPQLYSLSGESVPFYKLNRFSSDFFPSDRISNELVEVVDNNLDMSRDFLSDFSTTRNQDDIMNNSDLLNQYIDDLILRFSMQWPKIDFSYDTFKRLTVQAFDVYSRTHRGFCKEEFYLELLGFLRSKYDVINPYYYDIPQDMVKKKFPHLGVPSGPPNDIVMIEEPPFILLTPGRKVDKKDFFEKILLLKSPLNCYRMNYLETIFPNAEINIIYLTRNPAASINGLYDGWLYRGFFSHNLKFFFHKNNTGLTRLRISGYSNQYEWSRWWWNFNLPPGWQDYIERSLEEVCAFQWYSTNKATQEYISGKKVKFCQVKYENIVSSLESRVNEIGKITNFIGIDKDVIKTLILDRLPIVQATQPPQFYRWKKRKDIILPILNDPKISKMYNELGYGKESIEKWI